MRLLLAPLVLLAACAGPDVSVVKHEADDDNDGYTAVVDCDDAHATVNPDAPEACDGLDNDCDGTIDEDVADAPTWHADADGDGFGDGTAPTRACEAPDGAVADATDCDDTDDAVFPGAEEVCNDVDDDCDGAVDDDPVDLGTFYVDADGDGYGDPATGVTACAPGAGEVAVGTDCDDADAAVHPDAPEDDCTDPTDYNCDGSVGYADADADGTPACADCDDLDAGRAPTLPEVCDAADVDEDCDSASDDDDASVSGAATWGRDADGDGYAGAGPTLERCEAPAGYAAATGDCDDADAAVRPGAAEVCDASNTDEDCDGLADDADPSTDAATWRTFYADDDGDTYGGPGRTATQCDAPSGYVTNDDDCDDTTAAISPADAEVCDASNVDEDCDGLADDADTSATGRSTWYRDADADTFGNVAVTLSSCDLPAGYVTNDDDCNDAEGEAWPGNAEVCDDGIDQDCSGADEACPSGYAGEYGPDDGYLTRIHGLASGDDFGYSMMAGDFDGDGAGDLVVGAMDAVYDTYAGTVYGYYAPFTAGAQSATAHDDFLHYNTRSVAAGLFGTHLWNLGDLDGDGDDDVLVSSDDVVHYLYLGGGDTGAAADTTRDDGEFNCTAAARAGDFTSPTGTDDWLCAVTFSYDFAGVTYLRQGTSSSTYATFRGEAASDVAGTSVAGGHDVDGDGYDDAWIGAPGNDGGGTSAGAAYLVYAPVTGTMYLSSADAKLRGLPGDTLGSLVTMPGDLDGDGHADVVAVAPYADDSGSGAGAVYVFADPASGAAASLATATLLGESASDYFGQTAVSSGDFDGDGALDLLVGSSLNDGSGANAGATYLFYGPLFGTIGASDADATWRGASASDQLGYSVAAIPDADADGRDEIAFAARNGDHDTYTNVGAVWIWPGL